MADTPQEIIARVKQRNYEARTQYEPDILWLIEQAEKETATPPADAALVYAIKRACSYYRQAGRVGSTSQMLAKQHESTADKIIDAALRARSAPTHNLTEQDTADIARVLCWLKHSDTPPAAEIERIVHRNAELRGIVDDLRARAVPEADVRDSPTTGCAKPCWCDKCHAAMLAASKGQKP